ncbi:MAG: type IV secretory system conjugative DNA transfer family protein [Minisyncoccia bacterium]
MFNEKPVKFSTPEEEIAFLREQISKKEAELKENNLEYKIDDVVSDQISRYKNTLPQEVLDETLEIAKHDIDSIVLNLEPERHDKKMEELLSILKEKGIKNSLSVLFGLKDAHLEDDFHRFLVQYVKKGYDNKNIDLSSREFRGLNMTLYEVVLPEEKEEQSKKPLKELISSMEQFLSGMLSVASKDDTKNYRENYIVLELANPVDTDQFVFYIAVPNAYKDLFQRQIISFFHNVKLTEATSDYNIFNEDGVSVASYLQTTNNYLYPLKTYENFDIDPLNVLISSFSKIDREGEGAAVQIIYAPKEDYYNTKARYAIEQIEDGVDTKYATDLPENFTGAFRKSIVSLFKPAKKVEDPDKPQPKKIDTEAIERIKRKNQATIVATNIRLLASSKSRPDAERILNSLEASFNQFADSTSNSFKSHRVDKGSLQTLLRDYSFRSYNPDHLVPLNLHEVTSIFHFHTQALAPQPQLKQTSAITAPAPTDTDSKGTLLGVNNFRNIETSVYMTDEDRLRHMYVIGQTGTGKTVFLKNLIIQDIQKGNGCCFIDPHGTDVMSLLANIPPERYKDVIYFDPSYVERPMALNMLEYDRSHPEQKTFVVNELFSIFQKLYGGVPESMGPMFEQYFRNATMLVIEDPDTGCTLLDVSRVMSNKEFRQLKLANCKNPVVKQFWTEVAEKAGGEASLANIVPYITSKFDVFLANDIMRPIIAQEKSSFNFRELMDNKKILLVNLSKGRLGDINANLIGLILVGKILMAALSRVDMTEKDFPPFYLYIDEFQNITTDSISTILSEARKYKLSLTVAHQFIKQLQDKIRDAVFGNVGSIVSFRINSEDAEFLEKQFSPEFTAKDIMGIENFNAYVKTLVRGVPQKAFNIKEGFPPKGKPEIVETLKQVSYLTYGGDRNVIESGILNKYKK